MNDGAIDQELSDLPEGRIMRQRRQHRQVRREAILEEQAALEYELGEAYFKECGTNNGS